jgi:hypothetical protein
MEVENRTKVASLIELIKEDRIEIRENKKILYSTMRWFIFASIVITAYGLDYKGVNNLKVSKTYLAIIDLVFFLISWLFFYLTKRDLINARKSLKKRQDQLTKDFEYDYFQNSNDVKPDIKDTDLFNVILIASIIYIVLIIFTVFLIK